MHAQLRGLPHRAATVRAGILTAVLVLAGGLAEPARGQEFPPEELEHFESKIRPVLAERCYPCHGANPERIQAGLALVDAAGLRAGGDSGAVVVPGSPDDSLLIDVIRYDGPIKMPPDGRLPTAVVADFERWVARGAVDPRTSDAPIVVARSSPTRGPTPTNGWSSGCSRRRATASAGAGTGSTSPATPTRTGSTRTSRTRMRSAIATGSSRRSTATSRTTGSCRSRLPAT